MPALRFGRTFLDHWRVREEPGGVSWQEDAYRTFCPSVFIISNALVHSDAGIVCVGDFVIAETLEHTDPDLHRYRRDGGGIWIEPGNIEVLDGTHVSALAGGGANYHHMLIDGVGRLSSVSPEVFVTAQSFLFGGRTDAPHSIHDAVCTQWGAAKTRVEPGDTLLVSNLVLASTVHSQACYHPCLADMLSARLKPVLLKAGPIQPKALYVDRRRAWARKLVNEDALVDALSAIGVVSVALENMPVADQVSLFHGADLIVAPHGAGLANLVFASKHCAVLELQMDAYCNWCFRRLSALMGLRYDCIIGRGGAPWSDLSPAVHGMEWEVSIPHVVAATRTLLAENAA